MLVCCHNRRAYGADRVRHMISLFDISGLAPHGTCLLWRPEIFWGLVGADLAIAVAYVSISSSLLVFIHKRQDTPLRGIGGLFAAFILLCAASHATDIWTMWIPEYGVQVVIKLTAAITSLSTAGLLWLILPDILLLPSLRQMARTNALLKATQDELISEQQRTEMKVEQRTFELGRTTLELQQTINELGRANTQLEQARTELEALVQHDSLTGVWNRRKIREVALQEILRMDRYGHPVSMIFVDLDHFKSVNDCFGHTIGDQVLREFCVIANQCIRSTDLLGRWGGEEFIILTPNGSLAIAVSLAQRICEAFKQFEFQGVGHISASLGVAMRRSGESWDAWLERADAALYKAKETGRSRVVADPM